MIDKGSPEIKVSPSKQESEHGLCPSAETHWAIYLIQLINANAKPLLHEGHTSDGKQVKFLMKGEDARATGFTFGADSYLVVSSDDPALEHLLLVEEAPDVYVGRPLIPLVDSLQANGFYDSEIKSRWKDCMASFAQKKGVLPNQITLSDLIQECLSL